MDSLETSATLGTQCTGRRQTKLKNTTQRTAEISSTDTTKISWGNPDTRQR